MKGEIPMLLEGSLTWITICWNCMYRKSMTHLPLIWKCLLCII